MGGGLRPGGCVSCAPGWTVAARTEAPRAVPVGPPRHQRSAQVARAGGDAAAGGAGDGAARWALGERRPKAPECAQEGSRRGAAPGTGRGTRAPGASPHRVFPHPVKLNRSPHLVYLPWTCQRARQVSYLLYCCTCHMHTVATPGASAHMARLASYSLHRLESIISLFSASASICMSLSAV